MHPMFPCPNPACTHTFSSDAVKGASKLLCPKCGTVLQFASGFARQGVKPPTASPPIAAADVPLAVPVDAAPSSEALDFSSTPALVTPRSWQSAAKGRLRRLASRIILLVVVVLAGALVVWGGMWLRYFLQTGAIEQNSSRAANPYNADFPLPSKPWTRDKNMQMRLHVHIAMTSPRRNESLAVLFKDYKTRLPSDAEMLDEAVSKLRSYFRGVEWELKPKDQQTRLAGRPATVFQFQGDDPEQVTVNGECYMLAYRGYGYWFFTWAPLGEVEKDSEEIHAEWAALRQQFRLLDGRKGWTEKPRETVRIVGKKAKYQLSYLKELWTRETVEDDDPQLDLLLKGHEPDSERRPLAAKDATVQVLVLPRQTDLKVAAAAARDEVKKREEVLYPRTTMEPIKDKNGDFGRDADIGAERGHLSKLHVKNTEELERFMLIAVVNRPEGVVVLVGDCLWERRDFWDQELMALLAGFKVR